MPLIITPSTVHISIPRLLAEFMVKSIVHQRSQAQLMHNAGQLNLAEYSLILAKLGELEDAFKKALAS